jgi:hypothetical protein
MGWVPAYVHLRRAKDEIDRITIVPTARLPELCEALGAAAGC